MNPILELHCDGFTLNGNPSKIGGGFTIIALHTDGTEKMVLTHTIRRNPVLFADRPFTNNEGELLGAHYAALLAPEGMKIITDSNNTIKWVNGGNKSRPDLDWICRFTAKLMKDKNLSLEWRPREENLAGIWNENNGK